MTDKQARLERDALAWYEWAGHGEELLPAEAALAKACREVLAERAKPNLEVVPLLRETPDGPLLPPGRFITRTADVKPSP